MKKHALQIICIAAVMVLIVSVFSGCGNDGQTTTAPPGQAATPSSSPGTSSSSKESNTEDNENLAVRDGGVFRLPIVDEPLTLKMWFPLSRMQTTAITNFGDVTATKMLVEKTGITVEFLHPAVGQEQTSYNLLISSGDYPDMIYHGAVVYNGGWDKAVSDGIYLRLNEYIDKYAPNYQAIRNLSDEHRKLSMTDSGNIYGFHEMMTEREPTWTGLAVRKDWLDDLGMQMPKTIDDWEKMLTAFRDKKNAAAPLMILPSGKLQNSEFCSAWDIGTDFFQVNGVVKYGPIMSEYKEYLALMRRWYTERLIDRDFTTRTDMTGTGAPTEMTCTGMTGAFPAVWGACHDVYVQNKTTDDPNLWLEPVVAPTLRDGDDVHFRAMSYQCRAASSIFATTEHPVECVKWFDYLYTDEAKDIMWWADETVHYIDENGEKRFTEMMINDPNGLNFYQTTSVHICKGGIGIHDWRVMRTVYPQELLDVCLVWDSQGYDYVMPPVTLTDKEGEIASNILADINTFVEEYSVKCIIGAESLDRFDDFAAQVRSMGIDKVIEVYQNALTRYVER